MNMKSNFYMSCDEEIIEDDTIYSECDEFAAKCIFCGRLLKDNEFEICESCDNKYENDKCSIRKNKHKKFKEF